MFTKATGDTIHVSNVNIQSGPWTHYVLPVRSKQLSLILIHRHCSDLPVHDQCITNLVPSIVPLVTTTFTDLIVGILLLMRDALCNYVVLSERTYKNALSTIHSLIKYLCSAA